MEERAYPEPTVDERSLAGRAVRWNTFEVACFGRGRDVLVRYDALVARCRSCRYALEFYGVHDLTQTTRRRHRTKCLFYFFVRRIYCKSAET